MQVFKKMKDKKEETDELFNRLYQLNKEKESIEKEISNIRDKILELNPLNGRKSETISQQDKKFVFKQNYSSLRFDDKKKALEEFEKDMLEKYFKLDVKPKTNIEKAPEKIKRFYQDHLVERKPTSISFKIEELQDESE